MFAVLFFQFSEGIKKFETKSWREREPEFPYLTPLFEKKIYLVCNLSFIKLLQLDKKYWQKAVFVC